MVEVSIIKNINENNLYNEDLDKCADNVVNLEGLKNSSILITGASGLIGSYLVDLFCRCNITRHLNITIYALGRNEAKLKKRFGNRSDVYFIEQDVTKTINFSGYKFDYCIHAASNAYPEAMYNDPVGTIMANTLGTYNLLEYLRNNSGKRFLFVSSGEIYGRLEGLTEFVEESSGVIDILNSRSCYPLSKRTAENLCIGFSKQYGLETTIARLCHTYGPNHTKYDNRASVQFLNMALKNSSIVLNSPGLQLRSYEYIADTCSGLVTVLINGESGQAYNISNMNSITTIRKFAEQIAELTGASTEFAGQNSQPSPFDFAILNSKKLEQLGWKSVFSLKEGLEHTIRILRWLNC